MFFLHLKIRGSAKNGNSTEIWKRWEGEKKAIKNKSRKKKIRVERSRPDGQVDFLLDFFLAERKSIFGVYCFTSSETDWYGKAEVLGSGIYSQRRCVCTQASVEQRKFRPQIFHSYWDGKCGDCTRHGRELEKEQKILCLSLPAHTPLPADLHDKCSVLTFV